jgi:hypothetical protein
MSQRINPYLCLCVLAIAVGSALSQNQSDPVPPERATVLIDQRIEALQERLDALNAVRAQLREGKPVDRQTLEGLLDRNSDRRGAERGPPESGEARSIGGPENGRPGWSGGRPADGDQDSPWRRSWTELDEVRKQRVRDFLQQHTPEAHRRLAETDPAVAERILARALAPRVMRVLDAQDRNPELGELSLKDYIAGTQLFDAGMKLRQAFLQHGDSSDEFGVARESFRAALEKELDAKLALKVYEFKQLETRVAQQGEELRRERARKNERIEDALQRALERVRRTSGDDRQFPQQGRGRMGGPE